jgi:hypothetical protein
VFYRGKYVKNTILSYWLGIKNDYRTLIGFEGVSVVDKFEDLDEEEGDE